MSSCFRTRFFFSSRFVMSFSLVCSGGANRNLRFAWDLLWIRFVESFPRNRLSVGLVDVASVIEGLRVGALIFCYELSFDKETWYRLVHVYLRSLEKNILKCCSSNIKAKERTTLHSNIANEVSREVAYTRVLTKMISQAFNRRWHSAVGLQCEWKS